MRTANVLDPREVGYEDLLGLWADLEAALAVALAAPTHVRAFARKVQQFERWMNDLLQQDTDTALYLSFQLSTTSTTGYSASHALVCGVLCHVTAQALQLPADERGALVRAALTMNVAMTNLQDQLAEQTGRPTAQQLDAITSHPAKGAALLGRLGVVDADWLSVVATHHDDSLSTPPALGSLSRAERIGQVLRVIDRYGALISPRKSRLGRTVVESAQSVMQTPAGLTDEVGQALVQTVGLCPPGTFVRLSNGETAVVLRRSERANHPLVATVVDDKGTALMQPRLHRTAYSEPHIEAALTHASVQVQLNHPAMVRLGFFAARDLPERSA